MTGGNVSLYNQNPAGAIDPTPTVGMVGLVKPEHITSQWFKDEGDVHPWAGRSIRTILCLAWAARRCCRSSTNARAARPAVRLAGKDLHDALLGLIETGVVKAHDCAEGGLAAALAECAISELTARQTPRLTGAEIDLSEAECERLDALLYGEAHGCVIISTSEAEAGAAGSREIARRAVGTDWHCDWQ